MTGQVSTESLVPNAIAEKSQRYNLLSRIASYGHPRPERTSLGDIFRIESREDTLDDGRSSVPLEKVRSVPTLSSEHNSKIVSRELFDVSDFYPPSPRVPCEFDIVIVHSYEDRLSPTSTLSASRSFVDLIGNSEREEPSNRANEVHIATVQAKSPPEKLKLTIPEIRFTHVQPNDETSKDSANDAQKNTRLNKENKHQKTDFLPIRAKDQSTRGGCWFLDGVRLTQDFKNSRVLLFEYREPVDDGTPRTLSEITQVLRNQLISKRQTCPDRPIVFIGCDFGVTIIEKTLMDSAKDPMLVTLTCGVTAAIISLWTGLDPTMAEDPLYFEVQESRLVWTKRAKPKSMLNEAPLYFEISSAPDAFLKQHLEGLKKFHQWHAGVCPAISLLSMAADRPQVYVRILSHITDSIAIYHLLDAASNGDTDKLRYRVSLGRNVNSEDRLGRTALHMAVRKGQIHTVKALLYELVADPSAEDKTYKNALHYAASNHLTRYTLGRIVPKLVDAGTNLDSCDSTGLTSRQALLRVGVQPAMLQKRTPYKGPSEKPNTVQKNPDPPESEAATRACKEYLATLAEFYRVDGQEQINLQRPNIYQMLYDVKSGPDKILEKSAQSSGLKGAPLCKWYHIPVNHLGWVTDLFLKMGVITEPLHYDQHQGTTSWSRYMRPQSRRFDTDRSTDYHYETNLATGATGTDFVLYMPFLNFERRCDLLAIQKAVENARKWERQMDADKGLMRPTEPSSATDSEMGASNSDAELPASALLVSSPTEGTPAHRTIPPWNPSEPVAESLGQYKKVRPSDQQSDGPLDNVRDLLLGYLMAEPESLHHRRTLDQSHYFMLGDTSQRDADQVVLRRAREHQSKAPATVNDDEKHPLVMVDQLWLWVVGNTVITSFPQKWMQDDFRRDGDVLEQLLAHLKDEKRRHPISTANDLANLIVLYTTSIFNRHSAPATLRLQDLFEQSVREAADRQITLFRNFGQASEKDPEELYKDKDLLNQIFTIKDEVLLLDEIKDIRDELGMILQILKDQALAVAEMLSITQSYSTSKASNGLYSPQRYFSSRTNTWPLEKTLRLTTTSKVDRIKTQGQDTDIYEEPYIWRHRVIDANIRDFERMLAHANDSYEGLNHLLDLKQKQANAWEARLARMGAEASARSSNTVIVFTVATIVFGSLSFMTTFFALDIDSFPHNDQGQPSWHLGRIIAYITLISIGLSIPFVIIAFKINTLRLKTKSITKSITESITESITKILKYLVQLLRLERQIHSPGGGGDQETIKPENKAIEGREGHADDEGQTPMANRRSRNNNKDLGVQTNWQDTGRDIEGLTLTDAESKPYMGRRLKRFLAKTKSS